MEPWTRPIFDVLSMHYSKKKMETMMSDKIIETCPLGFMRGRSFNNSWIILDEAQNATTNQVLLVLTRIGEGSIFFMNILDCLSSNSSSSFTSSSFFRAPFFIDGDVI
jgi:phosphate starvation-inducible protein PhoH